MLATLGLGFVTLTYLLWRVPLPHAWHQMHPEAASPESWEALEGEAGQQRDSCRLVLVESVPQDLPSAAGSPSAQPLAQAWLQLLDTAQESVHVASYYWSLTGPDIGVNDSSSQPVHLAPTPVPETKGCPQPAPGWAHRESGHPSLWSFGAQVQGSALWGTGQGQGRALPGELWAGVEGGPGVRALRPAEVQVCSQPRASRPLAQLYVMGSQGSCGEGQRACLGPPLMASMASQGEAILQKLQQLLGRSVSLMVATNSPSLARNSTDLQVLAAHGARVRQVPMKQFTGGVLHSKFWVVDGRHIYVGSANMDWRSLTQVKELGAIIYNCSRLAQDLEKTFQTYWVLGAPQAVLPKTWPQNFSSHFNRFQPLQCAFDGMPTTAYFSASPPALCPRGRTRDLDAVLAVMRGAREFIYASVMDYFPTTRFSHPARYWPVLDNALREAAFGQRVRVRLLVSCGLGTDPAMFPYLRSLQAISNPSAGISVDVKVFIVPVGNHSNIPFSRVNHNKFMVTEKAAYIGTSNWSEDYFSSTSGVGLVVSQRAPGAQAGVQPAQDQLRRLFERDWGSPYAVGLDGQAPGQDCVWQG